MFKYKVFIPIIKKITRISVEYVVENILLRAQEFIYG